MVLAAKRSRHRLNVTCFKQYKEDFQTFSAFESDPFFQFPNLLFFLLLFFLGISASKEMLLNIRDIKTANTHTEILR